MLSSKTHALAAFQRTPISSKIAGNFQLKAKFNWNLAVILAAFGTFIRPDTAAAI
jgi:hypothetical protein